MSRTGPVTREEMMDCYQFGTVTASVDTHPKGGDAKQAPSLMGSAVGEAETPLTSRRGPHDE